MKIVVATRNPGKLREIKEIIGDSFELLDQAEAGADIEVEETGATFEENAMLKARTICDACSITTVADDSGLMVDYLNGEPGVYTARYAGCDPPDHDKNIRKLLKNMEGAKPGERGARFVSCVACAFPNGDGFVVRGECEGEIAQSPKGDGGFGYDPIFYYPPFNGTFSQISEEEKNSISHRKIAFMKFRHELERYLNAKGEKSNDDI